MGKYFKTNTITKEITEVDRGAIYDHFIEEGMNDVNLHESYNEDLDVEGTVSVGGYEFYPSRILEELDPTAYILGYDEYLDYHITEHLDELECGQIDELIIGNDVYTYVEEE
jgi:hypothetical protein